MQTREIDRERIRALAEFRSPEHPVVSLYMDLDPATAQLPRARRTQLDSLLAEAERRYLGGDGESHEQVAALRASLERIRSFFAEGGLAAKSARGIAVFSSAGAGFFEAYRLPAAIEAQVVVADTPFVEPLLVEYAKVDKETASLVHFGEFPTTLDATRLQRVATLMRTYGLLEKDFDFKPMLFAPAGS